MNGGRVREKRRKRKRQETKKKKKKVVYIHIQLHMLRDHLRKIVSPYVTHMTRN